MSDPQTRPIWPNSESPATLTAYPCKDGSGACVMILPGGGYHHLADHEGDTIARRCNDAGLHAAVLKYSLAPVHQHPQMIHDATRAARLLRKHGRAWGLDTTKLGVLGSSAGGHLAATLVVHPETFACPADDLCGDVSAKVDAAVLCYAVIDLLDAGNRHTGSRNRLVGEDADEDTLKLLSLNHHVTADTPPTFLWHTRDDGAVPVGNSYAFVNACHAHGVPYEMHVYESGRHGLGLAEDDPPIDTWFNLATHFLKRHLL